jgi:CubicO group peptidase (beta-lactamase class C family)
MKMGSTLALMLSLAAPLAFAAPPPDLDDYVAQAMKQFEPPGLSLAIVENGETVLARGYGIRKLGEKARADERTIFPIGSCTKAFTSAALAILVDDGKLSWEDKVVDKLPGFKLYDPYATAELTVRDLLVHRSGLGLGAGDLMLFFGSTYTRKQVVERLRYIKPASSFRYGFAYDNVLYVVAGQLVEAVSGMPWETFVEKRIFAPLGMKDSVDSLDKAMKSRNRGYLHARLNGEMRGLGTLELLPDKSAAGENPNGAPAGAIQASAVDMATWMKVQLAHGAIPGGGKRLFSEKQANEMWTGVTIEETEDGLPKSLDLRKPQFNLYALGWSVQDYRGHKVVTHSGFVLGAKAVVMLLPEKNIGIATMVNSEDGSARWAVLYHLLDYYLGLPPTDWIGAYKTAVDEIVAKGTAALHKLPPDAGSGPGPSLPLEKYAGIYEDVWYGRVTIKGQGQGLAIQFGPSPAMASPLEHVRYDTFRTRFPDRNIEDTYVTFALKPDGSIERVKMQAVSPLADFSFDYHDLDLVPVAAKP